MRRHSSMAGGHAEGELAAAVSAGLVPESVR